jgi:broad specificity phosphatase PhoE
VPAHIYLYRHASVDFDDSKRISTRDFRAAVAAYNSAPLAPFTPPQTMPTCDFVIASTLKRSADTAMHIFGFIDTTGEPFCEAELPDLPMLPFRAKPSTFFAIARVLWFLGRRKNCESRDKFFARVEKAAHLLVRASGDYQSVALIGHGVFNHFLARELRRQHIYPKGRSTRARGAYSLFTGR